MKISCNLKDLEKCVNIVLRAVPSRTTMPILECILLDAAGGELTLTANDMELGIETKLDCTVEEEGVIALDARFFSDIIRKLSDDRVVLTSDENFYTVITCGKARYEIHGRSGEDFSAVPSVEQVNGIKISQFTLREMIRQTIFSVADNDNNPLMAGELFETKGNHLCLVSLDGHRISVRREELEFDNGRRKAVILGRTMQEINRIVTGGADDDVWIYFSENYVVFSFDQTTVVSRLVEGEYFRIEHLISTSYETKITVNRQDLIQCIDRSIPLIREGEKKPIILNITDEEMQISMNSHYGVMDEYIRIQKEGRDLMIGFNPRFLLDALRAVDDEEVDLYMTNQKAPCYLYDEVFSYIYMILPVNFNSVMRR